MELGNKIRALRYKAGLTQEQLAEKLGVGAQAVSKWENSVAMPDISLLPAISGAFGVSIDELFDLSTEQRLNRIENSLDIEDDLPQDLFREYEDLLRPLMAEEEYKQRATDLMAYLYWHRMNAAAQKVKQYAKDSIRMAPGEKKSQWMLAQAERHSVWDWNISNQVISHNSSAVIHRPPDPSAPELFIYPVVGVHSVVALREYKRLAETEDISSHVIDYRDVPEEVIRNYFGEKLADSIITENEKDCLSALSKEALAEKWPQVREIVAALPSSEEVYGMLEMIGAKRSLEEIGVTQQDTDAILRYSPLVRNRLTLMRVRRMLDL